jgi:prepilin-type N-terminal cleavage/methylation domain-containing protein
MKRTQNKLGFSLIELLVVISIIAVLTAILMMNLVGARERSRDSQKIQDMNSIKSALRMYYNDNQSYPSNLSALNAGSSGYISGLGDTTGMVYTKVSDDSFKILIPLESAAGEEDTNSQMKCGLTPTPGMYAICAN